MDLEKGFLADIVSHPDDEGIRLIYSDWLAEQGTALQLAKSEWIRLQINNSRCRAAVPVDSHMISREMELQAFFEKELMTNLQCEPGYMGWRGGLLEEIHLHVQTLLDHGPMLFAQHPIQTLRIYWGLATPFQRVSDLKTLVRQNSFANLRTLDLSGTSIGSSGVEVLAQAGDRFGKLIDLNLSSCSVGDAGLRGILQSSLISQLIHLNLQRNDITTRGIRLLVEKLNNLDRSGISIQLKSLFLTENRHGGESRLALRNCRLLRGVQVAI